ncbi:MucBP domain-containing protein [Listeria kieliensis]
MKHQKKKKWINQIGKGIGVSLLSLLLISSQWVWPEKVSAALLENGSKAQPLVEQGIANAKAKNEIDLETTLSEKDWKIVRTTRANLGEWDWISYIRLGLTTNDGKLQMAMYGEMNARAFAYDSNSDSYVYTEPFTVFKLDSSQLPSPATFAQMTSEEAASYAMNKINIGTTYSFIEDDTSAIKNMTISLMKNEEQLSKGIIVVKDPTLNLESTKTAGVGTTFKFIGNDSSVYPLKNRIEEHGAVLPDGTSINLTGSDTRRYYLQSGTSMGGAGTIKTSYAATLNNTPVTFNQGDNVDLDPKSLVESVLDENGSEVSLEDSSLHFSWYTEPDTSTETTDGSAIIQIENPNGTTYLRVPYEVTAPVPGGDVTVNYLDENQQPIADSETLTGNVGESYTSTPKDITGWTLTEIPNNATGTFTDQPQTVTYVYEKADGGNITVNYQDADGNELAPSETVSGKYGDAYTTTEKGITGWTLTETPSNATGTFTDQPQTVTYVYEKADGGDITVNYQDADGNELAPPETVSGKYGDAYTTTEKGVTGWTLTETPSNATGTFTDQPQTVTYVYEKADGGDITVNYQDADGNELAPSETVSGKYGDAYTTDEKAITGWELTETPSNATGTFTDQPQTVTYVYEKADAAPVTVKFVDEEGQPLAENEVLTGKYGNDFTALAKSFKGYTLVNSTLQTSPTAVPNEIAPTSNASVKGSFSDEAQTVTFVYHHEAGEEVAVHYVDENGQKLAGDDTLTGLYGEAYDTDPKSIEGYVVKEVPANAEGTFGGTEQEVTYVYEKAEGGNITVNYVDEDGNPLTNPVIMTGKYGDAYTTDAQTIDGWTLKETPENAAGTFTAEAQTVTYVYEKVAESQPVTPGKQDPSQPESTQPSVTENGESAQVPSQIEKTTTEVAPLPKTGDQTAETSLLMGVGAAFLLLSGYVLRRTRNEKKKEA